MGKGDTHRYYNDTKHRLIIEDDDDDDDNEDDDNDYHTYQTSPIISGEVEYPPMQQICFIF